MIVAINAETLYVPRNGKSGAIGYCISCSKEEVRDNFSVLYGLTWEALYDRGWRIIEVDLLAKGIAGELLRITIT